VERLDVPGEEFNYGRASLFGDNVDNSMTSGDLASQGAESPPDDPGALSVLLNTPG